VIDRWAFQYAAEEVPGVQGDWLQSMRSWTLEESHPRAKRSNSLNARQVRREGPRASVGRKPGEVIIIVMLTRQLHVYRHGHRSKKTKMITIASRPALLQTTFPRTTRPPPTAKNLIPRGGLFFELSSSLWRCMVEIKDVPRRPAPLPRLQCVYKSIY